MASDDLSPRLCDGTCNMSILHGRVYGEGEIYHPDLLKN